MRQQLKLTRQFHAQPDVTMDWGFRYVIALSLVDQLFQFGNDLIQTLAVCEDGLRVTLIKGMSDGQQSLLRHLLRLLQRLRVQH